MQKKLTLFIFTFFVCITTSHSYSSDAHSEKKHADTAYVFASNVISTKKSPRSREYAALFLKVALSHPIAVTQALWNIKKIEKRAREIMQETNGTTNIIHQLLMELKKEGYGDLSAYENNIVAMSLNPEPNQPMIEEIKKLKQQVPPPPVYLATNQDRKQFKHYLEKLRNKGVPVEQLFDGYITTYCPTEEQPNFKTILFMEFDDASIMCPEGIVKPQEAFFHAIALYVYKKNKQIQHIIYTDHDMENLQKAQAIGFKTSSFQAVQDFKNKHSEKDIKNKVEQEKE